MYHYEISLRAFEKEQTLNRMKFHYTENFNRLNIYSSFKRTKIYLDIFKAFCTVASLLYKFTHCFCDIVYLLLNDYLVKINRMNDINCEVARSANLWEIAVSTTCP